MQGSRTGQQFAVREQAGKDERNGGSQNPETQHDTYSLNLTRKHRAYGWQSVKKISYRRVDGRGVTYGKTAGQAARLRSSASAR